MPHIQWIYAPKWANYAAMDQDGDWFWYEAEPECDEELGVFLSPEGARHDNLVTQGPEVSDWKKSLVKRFVAPTPSFIH